MFSYAMLRQMQITIKTFLLIVKVKDLPDSQPSRVSDY
ncbi:MAG: hypothetical protein [Olavius algarvensis Delta 4 endosymbiont]|nr:MAG: hypothetical protein [Olavius algarvensis Delta 4 endosymbiont]